MHTGNEEIQFLESILFEVLGKPTEIRDVRVMTGGTINTAVQVLTGQSTYFVKWNDAATDAMFSTEVRGLELLRGKTALTIPRVLHQGTHGDQSYLVLEFIPEGKRRTDYWPDFGQSLALLHTHTKAEFGLHFDNYIGALPQRNGVHKDGIAFFVEERLKVQAGLAYYDKKISSALYGKFEKLYAVLPDLLPRERPALVHGDLWSGNVITDQAGKAGLVDPAPHYGLREAEIAYTSLFGGFAPDFYAAYDEAFPLAENFDERIPIYNLYPLLFHVNIFGQSYVKPIEKVLNRF